MAQPALKGNSLHKSEPEIYSIFHKAKIDFRQVEEMFNLMGWSHLPDQMKLAVEEDVKGYIDELHGHYSSSCHYVQRRRESVDFWVHSFLDGLCTLDTALDALRVNRL